MNTILALLASFFRPAGTPVNATSFPADITVPPAGFVPDNVGFLGVWGALQSIDQALDVELIAVNGGTATAVTLTAAQFLAGVLDFASTAAGGITVTTPTAAQIIAIQPPTIPKTGYNMLIFFVNDNAGQTITLSGATGVTILGNNTLATNTMRQFLVSINVNNATVTIYNLGTQNL